ncbi:MAG: 2-C-methyl-D-erythritol 4-phosphate cytidylyltransferase [Zetaproteobacteria bacterium]|nr:MAG: 2-C-methyl-D-erythritol 4-phosphate cytidylyltransferase [Zetaproteobacteria bacterium]
MSHPVAVLLLAAGSGRRIGGPVPKQYLDVAGRALLCHTITSLRREPRIRWIQPVIAEGDEARFAAAVATLPQEGLLPPVHGGRERACSMAAGLKALPGEAGLVAVHDAARPLPPVEMLSALFDCAAAHGAAVPGLPVTDTIKLIDDTGVVVQTPPRARLRAVQTPQVARRDWLAAAIAQAGDALAGFTDDAALLEAAGYPVRITPGAPENRKITTAEDLRWLKEQLGGA